MKKKKYLKKQAYTEFPMSYWASESKEFSLSYIRLKKPAWL